jgi:hypothetical protein
MLAKACTCACAVPDLFQPASLAAAGQRRLHACRLHRWVASQDIAVRAQHAHIPGAYSYRVRLINLKGAHLVVKWVVSVWSAAVHSATSGALWQLQLLYAAGLAPELCALVAPASQAGSSGEVGECQMLGNVSAQPCLTAMRPVVSGPCGCGLLCPCTLPLHAACCMLHACKVLAAQLPNTAAEGCPNFLASICSICYLLFRCNWLQPTCRSTHVCLHPMHIMHAA